MIIGTVILTGRALLVLALERLSVAEIQSRHRSIVNLLRVVDEDVLSDLIDAMRSAGFDAFEDKRGKVLFQSENPKRYITYFKRREDTTIRWSRLTKFERTLKNKYGISGETFAEEDRGTSRPVGGD